MTDASPLFRPSRYRRKTLRSLLVTLGGACAFGIVVAMGALARINGFTDPDAIASILAWTVGIGVLFSAGVTTALLWLAVGQRTGDRGGGLDFMLVLLVCGLTAGLVLAPTLLQLRADLADKRTFTGLVTDYGLATTRSDRAFKIKMYRMRRPEGLRFTDLKSPALIARARTGSVEARTLIEDYRKASHARRLDYKSRFLALKLTQKGFARFTAPFEARLARDEEIRVAHRALLDDVIVAEDALISFIARAPGKWQGDRLILFGDANFNAAQRRVDDLNSAVRTLNIYQSRNGIWM